MSRFEGEQMKRKVTMVVGETCVGKSAIISTLMAQYKQFGWGFALKPFAHHYSERRRVTILGRYDEEHQFPGTVRLSMSVQPLAQEWIERDPLQHNVLFEGDRLGNLKMAKHLIERYDFMLVVVRTDPEVLAARRGAERTQPDTFVKGRATKIANIVAGLPPGSSVAFLENNAPQDVGNNAEWLWKTRCPL